jgi:hypothetical protein
VKPPAPPGCADLSADIAGFSAHPGKGVRSQISPSR